MAQHERVVEQLERRFPKAAGLLREARDEMLAFIGFPKEHWKQIWSDLAQPREEDRPNLAGTRGRPP